MIIAMGSINALIDGVIAARFIDTSTVGVIGLYYSMLRILEASGNVILGGVAVLSGKYMGSGRVDQTRGVISLGMALSFIIGAFLTIASFAVPGVINITGRPRRVVQKRVIVDESFSYRCGLTIRSLSP